MLVYSTMKNVQSFVSVRLHRISPIPEQRILRVIHTWVKLAVIMAVDRREVEFLR